MPLRQYVYFALKSTHTSADEMTAFLRIHPDKAVVRGSRRTEPTAIPVCHGWHVVCDEAGLRVDEQIARVLARLSPHTERIAELARRLDAEEDSAGGSAVLEVVRYFNDDDDAATAKPDAAADPNATVSEEPDLFGWHLDRDVVNFLAATGATLDVDEYDMTPDADDET